MLNSARAVETQSLVEGQSRCEVFLRGAREEQAERKSVFNGLGATLALVWGVLVALVLGLRRGKG